MTVLAILTGVLCALTGLLLLVYAGKIWFYLLGAATVLSTFVADATSDRSDHIIGAVLVSFGLTVAVVLLARPRYLTPSHTH